MAATLQLSWSSTTLNLHAGEDAGWRVSDWRPACAKDGEEWVWEEMIADVDEESDDALATSVRAMEAMQRYAQKYRSDILETTPVWLTCQMAGETNARRACVREIQMLPQSDEFGPGLADDHRIRFRLRIERRAFWEATAATTLKSSSALSGEGGEFDYTASPGADIAGSSPARLYRLKLSTSATTALDHVWIGFFDTARGTWTAKSEMESQSMGTDAAASTDTTASPGGAGNTRVTVSFATTATWASRVGGFTIPNTGRMLLLCRAKVDSGTVAEIRILNGVHYGDPVRVEATSWTQHELGVLTIPSYGRLAYEATSTLSNAVAARVLARRVSGSGNLYIDYLGYVPTDDLFVHVTGNGNAVTLYSTYYAYVNESPDGRRAAVRSTLLTLTSVLETTWAGAGIPVGDGRLYVFCARADGVSNFGDTISMDFQAVPRWRMLRGSN